ncbi:hypothetical protein M0R72_22020, partial [Candidatus Pacearchaeota archaeon]|nr:hypothetical protein [Candidatus Pacearchaeota archaeon]
MSNALQDAEALYELLGKSENYVTVKDVLKGAIDEIKRLQEENESQKTDYILMNKRYEAYIGGPCDDVKLLKDQIAKWQQIAVEERANRLAATHVLTGMVPTPSIPAAITTVEDHVQGFREQAAQELGSEQEAIYVKRLEEKVLDFYECDATRRGCCRQVAQDQARAALAK